MTDESPEQRRAEQALDEVTREVAAAELAKESARESTYSWGRWRGLRLRFGPLGFFRRSTLPTAAGAPDPDPGDERGLRDALHENDAKE